MCIVGHLFGGYIGRQILVESSTQHWQQHCMTHCPITSVSNGSGLPGFGPGWNRTEGPGPGQEPPSDSTRSVLVGLLPGPDINPMFFGRVEPGPQFHITVPATLAPIKYLSSDHITL